MRFLGLALVHSAAVAAIPTWIHAPAATDVDPLAARAARSGVGALTAAASGRQQRATAARGKQAATALLPEALPVAPASPRLAAPVLLLACS